MGSHPTSPFLAACRAAPHDIVPVWFMRQAGRSLPEYRALREKGTFFDAVRDPALAAEITLQPVRRYGVDAAILFSDIVVPVAAVGFGVDIVPGEGPVVAEPFRSARDLDRLPPFSAEAHAPYVTETVKILARELEVPLIGFAGAPFTVASYLIEGGPSRESEKAKAFMHTEPVLWAELLDRLATMTVTSLRSQIVHGARAVQLFDSWAGALSPADYRRHVLPASRRIFDEIADLDVPSIYFGVRTGELLGLFAEAGADVVGVDWRVPLSVARQRVGPDKALQGNLDPTACLAPWEVAAEQVREVLAENAGHPGYVFNLGHGVLPESDPGILKQVVDLVHEEGKVTTR